MREFELIERYLNLDIENRKDVLTNIGDDCAMVRVPRGQRLALSMDTLIGGTHFPSQAAPQDIAHKAVAVNLSDLAAVGAEPAWITLSLSLPKYDADWLQQFSHGLKKILQFFNVQLIGGDTCRGALSITIQAHGFVPQDFFIHRNTAKTGDLICVTGPLGDAFLGLLASKNELSVNQEFMPQLLEKYYRPTPRIAAGILLRGLATSAIDISDGLLADLSHITRQSELGAILQWQDIPLSAAAKSVEDTQLQMGAALTGGDDYELCFTIDEKNLATTQLALESVAMDCYPIGRIVNNGLRLLDGKKAIDLDSLGFNQLGYQHF